MRIVLALALCQAFPCGIHISYKCVIITELFGRVIEVCKDSATRHGLSSHSSMMMKIVNIYSPGAYCISLFKLLYADKLEVKCSNICIIASKSLVGYDQP